MRCCCSLPLLAACVEPTESTAELAVTSSYVSAITNAETGYTGTVVQNVVAST